MNINVLLSQAWDQRSLQRSASGVCAALLALRKLPVIRYSSASPLCQKLAEVFSARTTPHFRWALIFGPTLPIQNTTKYCTLLSVMTFSCKCAAISLGVRALVCSHHLNLNRRLCTSWLCARAAACSTCAPAPTRLLCSSSSTAVTTPSLHSFSR